MTQWIHYEFHDKLYQILNKWGTIREESVKLCGLIHKLIMS
jgi:hypothetical protein